MFSWILELLSCPVCTGRLRVRPDGQLLGCGGCPALYPILDDIPVLVPDPAGWMAAYRDAVLASLVEADAADRRTVALIEAFASAAGAVLPRSFTDDWTKGNEQAPLDPALANYVARARQHGPAEALVQLLPPDRARAVLPTILEVGTGDGELARRLRPRCSRLIVADQSLRAVLRARGQARRGPRDQGIAGVVLDAERLPTQHRRFDAIVAAHLVDVLEQPEAFLTGAASALRARGRLLLSVPEPTGLDALLADAGLTVIDEEPVVPWLRLHHERHVQIHLPRVLAAISVPRSRRPRRRAPARTPR